MKTLKLLSLSLALILAGSLFGCGRQTPATAPIPTPTEAPEEKPAPEAPVPAFACSEVTVAPPCPPACGFSFLLPEGWVCEVINTADEPTSTIAAEVKPDSFTDTRCLYILYNDHFAVCGTGLETCPTTFNGCEATMGLYDGSQTWDYIALQGKYQGCAIMSCNKEAFADYAEEIDFILSSLQFTRYPKKIGESAEAEAKAVWSVVFLDGGKDAVPLSPEDSRELQNALDRCKYEIGTADCLNDYLFIRADGSPIYYHSECGTFNDTENQFSYSLWEGHKEQVNRLLIEIFMTEYDA